MKKSIADWQQKRAENLLLTTSLPVKETALKMGYDDENLFVKFFVYHAKVGPAKYRNIYYNTHTNKKQMRM